MLNFLHARQMANMEKDMSRNWNKIRAVVSECGVVDGKVVDLLVGLGKMPLSEAAEKVKEATGVVQTYVTEAQAVVAEAEREGEGAIVNQASGAKDDLYDAVEELRGALADVREWPTWGKIKNLDVYHLPVFSDDSDDADSGSDPDGDFKSDVKGFKTHVKLAAKHVSSVSDAMKKVDSAANSALAVVALATREATRAVDEAPDRAARRAKMRSFRSSVSAFATFLKPVCMTCSPDCFS